MDTFNAALAAWLAFLSGLDYDLPNRLNPPATPAQIAEVEAEIGYALPDDVRALYLYADGQRDSLDTTDLPPGKRMGPLFGHYRFDSLEETMRVWRSWNETIRFLGSDMNDDLPYREGDPVDRVYWQKSWLPFTSDGGGNAWAIDLSPPHGGTVGQIIQMGPDGDERRVIASRLILARTRLRDDD